MVFLFVVAFYALLIGGAAVIGTLTTQYDVAVLFHYHMTIFQSFFVSLVTGGLGVIVAAVLKVLALLGVIVA